MPLELAVRTAPDSHILLLADRPGTVVSYLAGMRPAAQALCRALPADWPTQPPAAFSRWGVNHRNTELYHWILNGRPALVDGAGALFQTWHEPGFASSILKLDGHNEHFGLHSSRVGELIALVERIDVRSVHRAFSDWCKSEGKTYDDIDDGACEPFVEEFGDFGRLLAEAVRRRHGLIW